MTPKRTDVDPPKNQPTPTRKARPRRKLIELGPDGKLLSRRLANQARRERRAAEQAEREQNDRIRRLELETEEMRLRQRKELMETMSAQRISDPLAASNEMFITIAYTGRLCVLDPAISAADQRAELRAIAKTLATLMPDARRLAAEDKVRRARGMIEETAKSPPMTTAPIDQRGTPGPMQMSPPKV